MINIAKFLIIVILLVGCGHERRGPAVDMTTSPFSEPRVAGELPSEITESSGLVASPCQDGVLWTHNDSGDEPRIYAIDTSGKLLGSWRVSGAVHDDWEDMAIRRLESGKCILYIGDIGNSDKLRRDSHKVYRVFEPVIAGEPTQDAATEPAQVLEYRYPDGNKDAETMIVEPVSGDIYVLTKNRNKPSTIYKVEPGFASAEMQTAITIGDFTVPSIPGGFITGGSISPDGRSIAICDYAAGYEITLPIDVKTFEEIWKQTPRAFSLGEREQGEAIAYGRDGNTIYATSEKKGAKLIEVKRAQARTQ